ncbi:cbb3-type cytochrome c oxidase subunit 3 [Fluviicola sp.]|jgi:cbb3-type cytochrome oxidase subunit 3|uniref:cbb3-type cytochrome c oxidase subunit 3 n=1 Tax=Fluviicola sp. TaxID=1917219 RepID=UPI00281FE8E7|nr:cbb3-type cytochrome c oxidase subunit 3 [Fluviicola sp.]MDR0800967.1 cbb3-type cytochrome c oxidase subunit 3 [Fluviicola sp.]
MLRFIKHHLASEQGVEFYGLLSLLIFVLFFLIVLIRIWKMKKTTIEELSNIPLAQDEVTLQNEIQ